MIYKSLSHKSKSEWLQKSSWIATKTAEQTAASDLVGNGKDEGVLSTTDLRVQPFRFYRNVIKILSRFVLESEHEWTRLNKTSRQL